MSVQSSSPKPRRKKRTSDLNPPLFEDTYLLTHEVLGQGSYGRVITCKRRKTGIDFAVKIIDKTDMFVRRRVLKEIEAFYVCRGQQNIIQMLEFFEDGSRFYLIFEKVCGGPLVGQIQSRGRFNENEASQVIRDVAQGVVFLHDRGIAHRDLKPDNILCVSKTSPYPVKLCDLDLCSRAETNMKTPKLQTPVGSLEFMAPEVLDTFLHQNDWEYDDSFDENDLTYDKKCDLWSMGVILFIMLSGSPPFTGSCGQDSLDCGWDRGGECEVCQNNLANAIQQGVVALDGPLWKDVSGEAKDLIGRLLVKDAAVRINARGVLQHAWVREGREMTPRKMSPLKRQASVKELSDFLDKALTLKRAMSCDDATPAPSFSSRPLDATTGSPNVNRGDRPKLRDGWQRQASKFKSIDEHASSHKEHVTPPE